MDNASRKTGTVRGTARKPHFSHIGISVTKFGYRYFWLYGSNLHELSPRNMAVTLWYILYMNRNIKGCGLYYYMVHLVYFSWGIFLSSCEVENNT